MKKKNQTGDEHMGKFSVQNIIVYVLLALTMLSALIVPLALSSESYDTLSAFSRKYQVGELADEDVLARESFSFVDTEATERKIDETTRAVLPYFSYSMNKTLGNIRRTDTFISLFGQDGTESSAALDALAGFLEDEGFSDTESVCVQFGSLTLADRTKMFRLLKESMRELLSIGLYSSDDLNKVYGQGYREFLLENNVDLETLRRPRSFSISDALTINGLERVMLQWMSNYSDSIANFQPQLLIQALRLLATPNVEYDELMTLQRRQAAADAVEPVMISIEKGEYILQKDTVITDQALKLLQHLDTNAIQYTFLEQIGRLMFVLICTVCALLVFENYLPITKRKNQYKMLLLVATLFCELMSYVAVRLTKNLAVPTLDPFLPVLIAPIFISMVTSRKRLGMVSAFFVAAYATLLPDSNAMTFFYIMVEAGCCVYFIKFVSRRIDMIYQWFFSCLSCAFITVVTNLLLGYSFTGIWVLIIGTIINVSCSYVIVSVLVPVVEVVLNIPTAFRLHELAYADSPVLTRLNQVAQGTYNHSRIVADLSYAAARAIGANALLARVGGLYHDIGKADHPEYFIENQGGDNKHVDLKPSLSAAIIKSHVKLGMEKGRDAGLPLEVLDIIGEHHGNDVILYFYNEAKQEAAASARDIEVSREDFSYNGNPPSSPEAAIVMLSDCVEAASRTIKRPTTTKYQKLIHQIIMGKIDRHQLDGSRLSLTDLEDITVSFISTLVGRDHQRIEYPDENPPEQPQTQGASQGQQGSTVSPTQNN
jgi:putative nucleotidyltransferase with HDIG domain